MQLDAKKVAADIVDALERRKSVNTINRLGFLCSFGR